MESNVSTEKIFSLSPYRISVLGDDIKTCFFKTAQTDSDGSREEIIAEINQHIKKLRNLREAIEEEE